MKKPVWICLCLIMAGNIFAGDSITSYQMVASGISRSDHFKLQALRSPFEKKYRNQSVKSPYALPWYNTTGHAFKGGVTSPFTPFKGGINPVTYPFPSREHVPWPMPQGGFRGGSIAADTPNYHKRQNLCYAVGLGGTVLVHAALYQLWYKDYPSSSFHFFNDNHEWMQMDKCGHAFSSYYLGLTGIEAAKWAGVPENKQWKWALFGSIFQDPIEIWDGFSSGWGASSGDLIANTLGTVLSVGQHALWKEQKLTMKLSYTPSSYASMRPNVLGSNFQEQLLKDYNGQTYWLCYSPLKQKNWAWLGLAAGYGADGMVGGEDNVWTDKYNIVHDRNDIKRYRQYYLALDYNLTKIPTKSTTLKTLFFIFNCIKLPSPTLEFSNNRIKGHWLKF